jgi:hypothetical protein
MEFGWRGTALYLALHAVAATQLTNYTHGQNWTFPAVALAIALLDVAAPITFVVCALCTAQLRQIVLEQSARGRPQSDA